MKPRSVSTRPATSSKRLFIAIGVLRSERSLSGAAFQHTAAADLAMSVPWTSFSNFDPPVVWCQGSREDRPRAPAPAKTRVTPFGQFLFHENPNGDRSAK